MTASLADVTKQLNAIIDYVRDCESRVARGEIMDLQGLDRNVVEICDAIATLAPVDAKQTEDRMAVLIDDLEKLARGMKEQQDKLVASGGKR